MIGLILGAGMLGLIVSVMEGDEFPGWLKMMACVLAAVIPAALINAFLPPELFLVGLAVGAVCAGMAISLFCGMTVQRASIAAAIWWAIQVGITFALQFMVSA